MFGGASAIPGGIAAVAASSTALGLNNSSDTVTLRAPDTHVVDRVAYDATLAGFDGISMNRSPNADPAAPFVLHTQLAGAPSSPGRRPDGTAY